MSVSEINFDGLVGPTHNFAGLSPGNLAATAHEGQVSYPRAAALQGLAKMRANLELGLVQGMFVPPPRPNGAWLSSLAADSSADPVLVPPAWSASAMWAANAATVSPAADTADGRCHITVANLVSMAHRSHEWPDTLRQLRLAFADPSFAVHGPVPPCFGDEGAANHMRLAPATDLPGIEIFVYGRSGGPFPARQHEQASRAVARHHGVRHALFAEQHPAALAAGAFHNDVVAVANGAVLLTHELAFAEPDRVYHSIRAILPEAQLLIVPESEVSLAEAVRTYLFNAQLVTLPDQTMALIAPREAIESRSVSACIDRLLAADNPIGRVVPVDLGQSMNNGGGPACLRLRVVADPATIDPRFLVDQARIATIARVVERHWPQQIDPQDLGDPGLAERVLRARSELLITLDLEELA